MKCEKCEDSVLGAMACVNHALDVIKQHVNKLIKTAEEKDSIITSLRKQLKNTAHLGEEKIYLDSEHIRKRPKIDNHEFFKHATNSNESLISPQPLSQDSLNMNIALNSGQIDDDEDESIAETEYMTTGSPCRRLNPHSCVLRQMQKWDSNSENVQPRPPKSWLSKSPRSPRRPKVQLSLKTKSPKTIQTRLQFEPKINIDRKNVIESTPPNLYTSLRQAQRSLILRNTKRNEPTTSFAHKAESNDNATFFDFNSPKKETAAATAALSLTPSLSLASQKSDNPSLMIIAPATPDIVFVDDSSDESRIINTVDLLDSITQLKKHEALAINKQKKQYQDYGNNSNSGSSNSYSEKQKEVKSVCIKTEVLTEPANAGNETTKLPEDIERDIALSTNDQQLAERVAVKEQEEEEDNDEEVFPMPITVKRELTYNERFNITCRKCEMYVNKMGAHLTDTQIRTYLINCQHRNVRDERSSSPEGFWNPHMVSFASDDPRNEVLIDERCANKKRLQ